VKAVFKAVKKRGRPKVVKTYEEIQAEEDKKLDMKEKGRKRERWETYKRESEAKIEELREKLKNEDKTNMTNLERIRIRNKISAR